MSHNLTSDDKLRLWKSLAAYIAECEALSESATEPDMAEYYRTEISECESLRRKLDVRE